MVTLDVQALKASVSLREVAERYTSIKGKPGNGPCPMCGGVDRFFLHSDREHWSCRKCYDKPGDVLDLIQAVEGCDFPTACARLGQDLESFKRTTTAAGARQKLERPRPWKEDPHWIEDAAAFVARSQAHIEKDKTAQDYLLNRGLSMETIRAYGIGSTGEKGHCIVIPWFLACGTLTAIKYRLLKPFTPRDKEKPIRFFSYEGSDPILFGAHLAGRSDTLVLVEGEMNAMSLYQCMEGTADVLSTGSEANRSMIPTVAQQYKHKLLWYDSAEKALKNSAGIESAILMRSPCDMDANTLLQNMGEKELKRLIDLKLGRVEAPSLPFHGEYVGSAYEQRVNDAYDVAADQNDQARKKALQAFDLECRKGPAFALTYIAQHGDPLA